MEKIPTIFERDWDGDRKVVPRFADGMVPDNAIATEKVDGTNVRLTIRSGVLVRLEARVNPPKPLKRGFGITEPWYRDAWLYSWGDERRDLDRADQHIMAAALRPDLSRVPDGEWSAEAIGPKIQGNPLALVEHTVLFFDFAAIPTDLCVPVREDVPRYNAGQPVERYFEAIREWLAVTPSEVNAEVAPEGIVWHGYGEFYGKIKAKDFGAW